MEDLEAALGVPVVEAYGMTEAAHQMASNPLGPGRRKPGSVGPPAGPELAIAEAEGAHLGRGVVGEVVVRGRNVMAGYDGISERSPYFHEGGWFRTGDQGYLDEDGYLFLTGRLREMINRGGETIAPREIDEAILERNDVREAVAFAVPDPVLGEEVAAAVVLTEQSEVSEEGLKADLSDVLSFAKVPKRIVFVDRIPRGPTGKLQRFGLADRLGITTVRSAAVDPNRANRDMTDTITGIWKAVLEVDSIGPDDPFLENGGDSITATALAIAIEDQFNVDLPLLAFYNAATIREQAMLVEELLDQRV
jgi:acyl-CoA synthetase (AMP-forming)/AMP-acid ligase II/acyl carrier protein